MITEELQEIDLANKDEYIGLHKNYMKEINKNSITRNLCTWCPKEMEYKNLFGYANDIIYKIVFGNGITSIQGSNASGKSSILNILFFAIFGELLNNPGKSKNWDILNNEIKKVDKEPSGYVKLFVSHGTKMYIIYRTFKKTGAKIDATLTLSEYDNGRQCIIMPPCDPRERLVEMFGTMEDYYISNVSNLKDMSYDLLNMQQIKKIECLKKIFRMKKYDELLKINAEKMENCMSEINKQKNENEQIKSDILPDDDIKQLESDILEKKQELVKIYHKRKELQIEIEEIKKSLIIITENLKNGEYNIQENLKKNGIIKFEQEEPKKTLFEIMKEKVRLETEIKIYQKKKSHCRKKRKMVK